MVESERYRDKAVNIKRFLKSYVGLSVGLALVSSLSAGGAYAAAPMDLLKLMVEANQSLNYTGTFVYSREGMVGSMEITRKTEDDESVQRLFSLNGEAREIIRNSGEVLCFVPDSNSGVREASQSEDAPFPMLFADDLGMIEKSYDFESVGASRVANRACEQIRVVPKDSYRYGYDLCIDQESHLLLSSNLLDDQGHSVETYMFVSVNFDQAMMSVAPTSNPQDLLWMDQIDADAGHEVQADAVQQRWTVQASAANFSQQQYIQKTSPVLNKPLDHIVLTDGLATISVFVVPMEAGVDSGAKSARSMSMGATNTYTRTAGDYQITAMGEVPKSAVQLIANSVVMK